MRLRVLHDTIHILYDFQTARGLREAIKQARGLELLPFVGSLYKADRIGKVLMAAERLRANPSPPTRHPFLDEDLPFCVEIN